MTKRTKKKGQTVLDYKKKKSILIIIHKITTKLISLTKKIVLEMFNYYIISFYSLKETEKFEEKKALKYRTIEAFKNY